MRCPTDRIVAYSPAPGQAATDDTAKQAKLASMQLDHSFTHMYMAEATKLAGRQLDHCLHGRPAACMCTCKAVFYVGPAGCSSPTTTLRRRAWSTKVKASKVGQRSLWPCREGTQTTGHCSHVAGYLLIRRIDPSVSTDARSSGLPAGSFRHTRMYSIPK